MFINWHKGLDYGSESEIKGERYYNLDWSKSVQQWIEIFSQHKKFASLALASNSAGNAFAMWAGDPVKFLACNQFFIGSPAEIQSPSWPRLWQIHVDKITQVHVKMDQFYDNNIVNSILTINCVAYICIT